MMSNKLTTEEFILKAKEIFGNRFGYITDRNNPEYFGEYITHVDGNGKIGVKCNKHGNIFETHPKGFLKGDELCPICKFENSTFVNKIKNKNDYNKKVISKIIDIIYIHKNCNDKSLNNKIIDFILNNIYFHTFRLHDFYINSDYTIDVKMTDLNNLNKDWRGVVFYIDNGELPSFINFDEIISSQITFTIGKTHRHTVKDEEDRIENITNGQSIVKKNIIVKDYIENFKGLPTIIYGNLSCVDENLTSLIGSPKQIYGDFIVKKNNIESLDSCPKIIHGNFDISWNKIKSIRNFNDIDCEVFGKLNRKNNFFVE